MRKLLLFSSVCALSIVTFAQNDILGRLPTFGEAGLTSSSSNGNQGAASDSEVDVTAPPTGGPGIVVQNPGLSNTIATAFERMFGNQATQSEELRGSLQRATQQLSTVSGVEMVQGMAGLTALSTNDSVRAQQSYNAASMREMSSVAERGCITTTSAGAVLNPLDHWLTFRQDEMERRMAILNSQEGTLAANGVEDFYRQLDQQRQALCDPSGEGGSDVNCTGSGNDHFNAATVLYNDNISEEVRAQQVEYLTNLFCARILPSSNPDLNENPNTDTRIINVKKDIWKARLSACQATISDFVAMRTVPEDGGRFVPYLIDALTEGDAVSPELVEHFAPNGNASMKGIMSLLTYMRFNANFDQQTSADRPELNLLDIKFNTSWTNFLLLQMNNNLEKIAWALNTGGAISDSDFREELAREIQGNNN